MAERWPSGMLFVCCKGGISHHPVESVSVGDVALAIAAGCKEISARKAGGHRGFSPVPLILQSKKQRQFVYVRDMCLVTSVAADSGYCPGGGFPDEAR